MKHFSCLFAGALALASTVSLDGAPPTGKTQQLTSPDQVPEGLAKSDWLSIRAAYEAGQHALQPIAQQAYLKAHQINADGDFGISVAVSGDTVVVGSPGEASSTPNGGGFAMDAGAAYVFVRSGTNWTQQAYLKAHQVSIGDRFGISVAVSSDTVVVGAFFENSSTTGINSIPNESAPEAGAAYVFVRNGTNWTQQAYLKAHQVSGSDYFGSSVAVSGDTVVVGASFEDGSNTGVDSTPNEGASNAGAAYVFVRSGTNWTQEAYLKAHQVNTGDLFGCSVAVSGDTVAVGASYEDSSSPGINSTPNERTTDAGAAYVFVRNGTNWTQQAYLKAHQVSRSDYFGSSVAVSGDAVVVGSPEEDGSNTGVNSTPNEGASNAGAAYVFVRSGTNWTQQAYLKAHQVGSSDYFGSSVAVSGDTVVGGAYWEDSSTTGINSTPNESVTNAGAAYVFVRSGTNWTQEAYLKAHQVNTGDLFGRSVAVSGDTVVVGAPGEDSSTTGINSAPNENATESGATYVFTGFDPPPFISQITSMNPFQFQFDGGSRSAFDVEASTNLIHWMFIGQATNPSGSLFQFNDSSVTNFPFRFYRLKVP